MQQSQLIDKVKEQAKSLRDDLQKGIYKVINPFVHTLIRMRITPNIVTTIGLAGNAAAAVMIFYAGATSPYHDPNYLLVLLAGLMIIAFSLFDMLDGQVARIGNMTSKFGAMYDSVLDRYCELLMFGSIAYFLLATGSTAGALFAFFALIGSVMVSYVRARAEGLGIECKIGFMQRPERVVVTAVALIVTGLWGICIHGYTDAQPNIILTIAMVLIAVFANLTALARLFHSYMKLKD